MPTYRYESKNAQGKVTAGVLSAANLGAASEQLRARGEYILSLAPVDSGANVGSLPHSLSLGGSQASVASFADLEPRRRLVTSADECPALPSAFTKVAVWRATSGERGRMSAWSETRSLAR